MAVQPQTPYKEYTANGVTTVFPLDFDCKDKDHLIVMIDDAETDNSTWSLNNDQVTFNVAPATDKKITLQRNTPYRRDRNYQAYDNSFRPGPVNDDFDWIWWKLQELGLVDELQDKYVDFIKKELMILLGNQDMHLSDLDRLLYSVENRVEMLGSSSILGGKIFDTPEEGVRSTRNGDYFYIVGSENYAYIDLWKNKNGKPEDQKKSYPTLQDVNQWIDLTNRFKDGPQNAEFNSNLLQTAIIDARNLGRGIRCAPRSTVYLNKDFDMSGIRYISLKQNTVLLDNRTITVGKNSTGAQKHEIEFAYLTNGTNTTLIEPPTVPLLRIFGLKQSEIKIGECNYVQLYADASDPKTSSNAYNNFYLTGAISLLEITDSGVANSWINNNNFYGGRPHRIRIKGVGYQHNHNKFFACTSENSSSNIVRAEIRFENCNSNVIYDNRLESIENAGAIFFDINTRSNTIIRGWSIRGIQGRFDPMPSGSVVDLGRNNSVLDNNHIYFDKHIIASFNACTDTVLANSNFWGSNNSQLQSFRNSEIQKLTPNFNSVAARGSRAFLTTEIFKAKRGDVFTIEGEWDGATCNPYIFFYDSNMQPILTDSVDKLVLHPTTTTFNTDGGYYLAGRGVSASELSGYCYLVNDSRVAYVQVAVRFTQETTIRNILISLFNPKLNNASYKSIKPTDKEIVIYGMPTQGWLAVQNVFYDSLNRVKNTVSFSCQTYLMEKTFSGNNILNLHSIFGATNRDTVKSTIQTGDLLGVQLVDGSVHWSSVADITGNLVTLVGSLLKDSQQNALVKVCRFAVRSASHAYAARTVAANTIANDLFSVLYTNVGSRVEVYFHGDSKGLRFYGVVESSGVRVYCQNLTNTEVTITASTISINVFNA